jgi:hypothetical protein
MSKSQSYDPHRLINDVIELLEQRGLTPERVDIETPGARVLGASLLLRGLGIDPLATPEDALNTNGHLAYNRRIHGD